MPLTAQQRNALIDQYAAGPAKLEAALKKVPAEALKWKPAPNKWSVHEVIVHCADSETNAASRIRYVAAEPRPTIVGYDQEQWARAFDYHQLPMDTALATVKAVRALTTAVLRRFTEADWAKTAHHTEDGAYGAEAWLKTYAEHLEKHSGQIERNLAAWKQR